MIAFEVSDDHVIAARAEGKLTREDIKSFVAELDRMLARHESIGIVADVTGLEGMTFEGLVADIRAEFKYLGQWHRFPKVALVADEGFLKSISGMIGHLVPQVELRTFAPAQRDAALAFAAEAGQ